MWQLLGVKGENKELVRSDDYVLLHCQTVKKIVQVPATSYYSIKSRRIKQSRISSYSKQRIIQQKVFERKVELGRVFLLYQHFHRSKRSCLELRADTCIFICTTYYRILKTIKFESMASTNPVHIIVADKGVEELNQFSNLLIKQSRKGCIRVRQHATRR